MADKKKRRRADSDSESASQPFKNLLKSDDQILLLFLLLFHFKTLNPSRPRPLHHLPRSIRPLTLLRPIRHRIRRSPAHPPNLIRPRLLLHRPVPLFLQPTLSPRT
ncbi:hypothetical protein HRI_001673600 [Hibiscus trionum]|uniref:Uncharacterized protein n=1 Tax=Hibiscus trionum TaxID=183268 RepID=A0A9W7LXF9_HIBTR|nr:hypothetical protein HRI_001673600 [Hibiscus trionum]